MMIVAPQGNTGKPATDSSAIISPLESPSLDISIQFLTLSFSSLEVAIYPDAEQSSSKSYPRELLLLI